MKRSWLARHPVGFMALYTIFYLSVFHYLEANVPLRSILVHCRLDDLIPFCKYAVIPYFAWFVWIPFTLFYLLWKAPREDFWRLCLPLFSGMTIALACYAVLPTALDLRLIAVVAVSMTAASMVIIPYVARIFVGYDVQLLALTSRAFRLYALSFLIMGFNVYASSFFTALGDGVTSALISFLRTLVFQLAALLLLPALWGIDGVWLAVTAAELAALAVSVYMFVTKDQKFHYRHG